MGACSAEDQTLNGLVTVTQWRQTMKILKRTKVLAETSVAYLKYDGWVTFTDGQSLDLTDCILFTDREAELNKPKQGEEYQHYGCYKELT